MPTNHGRLIIGFVFFLLLILYGVAAAPEFPGQNDKWRYYQSPHFELYSGNNDSESRDLLYKMEVLRALFLEKNKLKERRPVPVTVYYFGSEKVFRAYTPSAQQKTTNFAGYYLARPDRSVIMMAPREDEDRAQTVVFHEYIHHLMSVTEQKPPPWYNEGMAELFSTIILERDHIEFGHPSVGRILEIRRGTLLPLEQLFATTHESPVFTEGKHTGMFYAQSWGLLHMCYLGMSDLPREKLDLFLQAARSPAYADPQKAKALCQELLGLGYEELNKKLTEYMQSGDYRYGKLPIPEVTPAKAYTMRIVGTEEMGDRLAELELRVNRTGRAALAMLQAAERNPNAPRPFEVLGGQARMEGDMNMAKERWTVALARGSENPAVFHELGQIESKRWFAQMSLDFRLPDETATRLRELLQHSIKNAPDQIAAYEMLAWVEATASQPQIGNINLVQKHLADFADKRRVLLATALTMWRLSDNQRAGQILDGLAKLEPDPWVQWGAETLRAKIENRKPVRPATSGTKIPKIQIKVPNS